MLKYIRQWVFKIVTHSTTTQKIELFHTAEGFLSLENCPLCPHQNLNLTLRLTTILISITIDSLFTWASTSYSGNYISTLLYLTLFAELRHSHVLVWVSVFSSFYSWVALIPPALSSVASVLSYQAYFSFPRCPSYLDKCADFTKQTPV